MTTIERYGVRESTEARDEFDVLAEELRLLGYTTLSAGLTDAELDALTEEFEAAHGTYAKKAADDGYDLAALGEQDTIRALPVIAPGFWALVFNERLHTLLSRALGDYYILNQANGLNNRANGAKYTQGAYHRDLPYQHFVSSRSIAINALFALDDFTLENGATRVIPASQHQGAYPSEETIRRLEKQIAVPRGTYIVLDCMLYHAGSVNRSARDRRAVNHVFTIPMLRQQLHMPSLIASADKFDDRQKRILGYGLDEYRSTNAWFQARAEKR